MAELSANDVALFKQVLTGNRNAADTFAKKYTQNSNKILICNDNTILWIWNPDLIKKTEHLTIR